MKMELELTRNGRRGGGGGGVGGGDSKGGVGGVAVQTLLIDVMVLVSSVYVHAINMRIGDPNTLFYSINIKRVAPPVFRLSYSHTRCLDSKKKHDIHSQGGSFLSSKRRHVPVHRTCGQQQKSVV